jgi:hypothetical protein
LTELSIYITFVHFFSMKYLKLTRYREVLSVFPSAYVISEATEVV